MGAVHTNDWCIILFEYCINKVNKTKWRCNFLTRRYLELTINRNILNTSNFSLRWYRTHQHMSKKLPSFDMLKSSSKLIYFDKNNRTLSCFLKSYLTLKIVKYEFFKISISHILKKLKVRNAIFFAGNTLHASG